RSTLPPEYAFGARVRVRVSTRARMRASAPRIVPTPTKTSVSVRPQPDAAIMRLVLSMSRHLDGSVDPVLGHTEAGEAVVEVRADTRARQLTLHLLIGAHRPLFEDEEVLQSDRSEEHTSELQSRENLVCRLLLEK